VFVTERSEEEVYSATGLDASLVEDILLREGGERVL
jgi:hypothetical protein